MNDALKPPESWTAWSKNRRAGWKTPFLLLEWLSQWIAYRVDRWAFLRVLEYTGKAVLFIAAIMYICNTSARKELRHGQAWIEIHNAQGEAIAQWRADALMELCKDRVSLEGIDLSNAQLARIDLSGADLTGSRLQETDLREADLTAARLPRSHLSGTSFVEARLRNAILRNAFLYNANFMRSNLEGADLMKADIRNAQFMQAYMPGSNLINANIESTDFRSAQLIDADFSGAKLVSSDFSNTDLTNASLARADLTGVNLSMANLTGADLTGIQNWDQIKSVKSTNLSNVENAPDGFMDWALQRGAVCFD